MSVKLYPHEQLYMHVAFVQIKLIKWVYNMREFKIFLLELRARDKKESIIAVPRMGS